MNKIDIKKEKDLFKSLDKLLLNKKEIIINWLETAKVENNYISGRLLNNNKLQIITTSEYGIYNFSVTQINPTTIKVSSFYEVNSTSIAASKTKMVEDIFTAIEKSNLMELKVSRD